MKKAFLAFVLVALAFSGCAAIKNTGNGNIAGDENGLNVAGGGIEMEKVEFKTEDGFTIKGNLLRGNEKAVVMLHQLNLNKASYSSFARKLNDANFTALAIDLRGHGESLDQNGVKKTWQSFSDNDFRNMAKDVKAAEKFLKQEGFSVYGVVGASIGANTAANYAAENQGVKKIILLSPGLDFRGIQPEKNAENIKAKALIVASGEDSYSFGSGKSLAAKIPDAEFKGLRNSGHGTNMFAGTFLENDLIEWLQK